MEKETVEHMHETMQSTGSLTNRVNCPHMEKERRSHDPRKYGGITLRSHIMNLTREDSGQEIA